MASMRDMQPRVGYRDLLAMPEDGRRYEIHGGELVVVPSPLPGHQIAAGEIFALLNDYRCRSGGWRWSRRSTSCSTSTTWCSRTSSSSGANGAIWCSRTP